MVIQKLSFKKKINPLSYSEILAQQHDKISPINNEIILKNILATSAAIQLNFSKNLPKDKTLKLFFNLDKRKFIGLRNCKYYVLHFLNELDDYSEQRFKLLLNEKIDITALKSNLLYQQFLFEEIIDKISLARNWELGHYYLKNISYNLFKNINSIQIEKFISEISKRENDFLNKVEILGRIINKNQRNNKGINMDLEHEFYLLTFFYYLYKKELPLSTVIRFENMIASKGEELHYIMKNNPLNLSKIIDNEINKGPNRGYKI